MANGLHFLLHGNIPKFVTAVLVIILIFIIKDTFHTQVNIQLCSSFQPSMDKHMKPDDPCLIQHISHEIVPPNRGIRKLLSDRNKHFSQLKQDYFVDNLLQKKEGGFFIECGAGNGVSLSNTLFFEQARGWTGLLVEANSQKFRQLKSLNRSAYLINNCLSIENGPSEELFVNAKYSGIKKSFLPGYEKDVENALEKGRYQKVQCYPLYSILLAVNVTHVDYFSLDVEGAELGILRTVPFSKVTIDVMTVEYRIPRKTKESLKKLAAIKDLVLETGLYEFVGTIPEGDPQYGLDVVFRRRDFRKD